MPKITTDLITTAQAAARLGVTPTTIINHMKAGRLVPVAKLPAVTGTYLFDAADVDALAAQ